MVHAHRPGGKWILYLPRPEGAPTPVGTVRTASPVRMLRESRADRSCRGGLP